MKAPYIKTAIAACLIMSGLIVGTVCLGFFMDPVTSDLGFDRSVFSLYFSLLTVVGTVTLPLYGRIIERVGARKLVIIGGAWTGIMVSCFSLCTTLPMFYIVGCLVGLGFFGCTYASVPVIVSNWFHEKQSTIMGLAGACGGAIAVIMSLVFPAVIESLGWSQGYVMLGAMVLLLTVPAGVFLLRSRPEELGLLPFGFDQNTSAEIGEPPGVPYKAALKSPRLWITALVFMLLAASIIITQHLPAYFVSVGFSPMTAGAFMSVISAGIIVTNTLAGSVSDKIGFYRGFAVFTSLYLLSFILLPISVAIPIICIALVIMSIGNATTTIFAPVATSLLFGPRDYASIWGIVSMANVLGQAIGAPLWGLAYDLTGGYQIGMFVAAAVVGISLVTLLCVIKSASKDR